MRKKIQMPTPDNEKQEICGERKTIVHRLTHKAYLFCNSKQNRRKLGPTNRQQNLTALPGDKNWKLTIKWRKGGCNTFGKLNLVGQISAVAAFEQFEPVVTWLVMITGLYCAGTISKYQHYKKIVEKKNLPKTWI